MISRDSERSLVPGHNVRETFSLLPLLGWGWGGMTPSPLPLYIQVLTGLPVCSVVSCHISQAGGLSLCLLLQLPSNLQSI